MIKALKASYNQKMK